MALSQSVILYFFIIPALIFIVAGIIDMIKTNMKRKKLHKIQKQKRLMRERLQREYYNWEYNFNKQFENIVNF